MPLAVIGIRLRNRRKQALEVQEVLTKYGDLILPERRPRPRTGKGAHHLDGRGVRKRSQPCRGSWRCLRNFSRHSLLIDE